MIKRVEVSEKLYRELNSAKKNKFDVNNANDLALLSSVEVVVNKELKEGYRIILDNGGYSKLW